MDGSVAVATSARLEAEFLSRRSCFGGCTNRGRGKRYIELGAWAGGRGHQVNSGHVGGLGSAWCRVGALPCYGWLFPGSS